MKETKQVSFIMYKVQKLSTNNFLLRILTILLLSNLYSGNCSAQRLFAIGLREQYAGLIDAKTIEVDSVLKTAKETIPFDKPFILKIKRQSRATNKNKVARVVKVDSSQVDQFDNGLKVKTSISREAATTIYDQNSNKKASQVRRLELTSGETSAKLTPNDHIVFADSNSSHIYVKMSGLRPDHQYKLCITWAADTTSQTEETENYSFTTVSPTLEKRVKERVVSQFGVTPIIFRFGKKDIYDVKTAFILGVHYHVRAVDPDIPVKYYRFFSPQRFSIFGAVTLNSIASKNVREDLFANNNILLGIGFQAADAIRFSYGAVLFNEINPNPLGYAYKNVKANSYVAITLDIKLKDILGGILTTFGFK